MIKAYDLLNRYKKLSKEECAANFRINGHTTKIMKQTNTKKLAVAAVFCAVAVGALICGLVYQKTQNIPATLIGEVFGTSVLGGLTAYPVAVFFMGKSAAGLAFYAYVIPFLVSTAGGAVISGVLIYSLKKANILAGMQEAMGQ